MGASNNPTEIKFGKTVPWWQHPPRSLPWLCSQLGQEHQQVKQPRRAPSSPQPPAFVGTLRAASPTRVQRASKLFRGGQDGELLRICSLLGFYQGSKKESGWCSQVVLNGE